MRPRRKPRAIACANDSAPCTIHTRLAEGSATASVRAVSAVLLDANVASIGTAPTSKVPLDFIVVSETIPIFPPRG